MSPTQPISEPEPLVPPVLDIIPDLDTDVPDKDPPGRPTLPLSLDKLIQTRLLLQADSGGGKSWAIRYVLEQTFNHIPHLVVDIEGEFATLRERFAYVLVSATPGEGDIPADPETASPLCRRLCELGASAVIDLYDLDETDQRRFTAEFSTALLALPKSLWSPRMVLIDEAERVAPEGEAAVSKTALSSLIKRARKRRIGVVLAAQSLPDVSKKVVRSLQNKMIGLATLDTDIKRAAAELGFDRDRSRELASLSPGTFFAHGPAFAHHGVRLLRTGPVETTHDPLSAGAPSHTAIKPPDSVADILPLLEDLSGVAQNETNGRTRQAQPRPATGSPPDKDLVEKEVDARLRTRAHNYRQELRQLWEIKNELQKQLAEGKRRENDLRRRIGHLEKAIKDARTSASATLKNLQLGPSTQAGGTIDGHKDHKDHEDPTDPDTGRNGPKDTRDVTATPSATPTNGTADTVLNARATYRQERLHSVSGSLGELQGQILATLVAWKRAGFEAIERENLAVLVDRSPRYSQFTKRHLTPLENAGLIEMVPSTIPDRTDSHLTAAITITDNGAAVADINDQATNLYPATIPALHHAWLCKFDPTLQTALSTLIDRYPATLSRADLAREIVSSPRSGSFQRKLTELRSWGLLQTDADAEFKASPILFPEPATGS